MNERWVEAEMAPELQAKCDLLGIRVMSYNGSKFNPLSVAYSVRKRHPAIVGAAEINNLCTIRADGTKEVAVFRNVEAAIHGATLKSNSFLK